uniref:Mutator-like transposase n=1 Tax=Arabidopsis thaliana TaxID=3702 RepID=Q9SIG1_ARATH|nr:Mutator-like transposase [Arabidopsis thaliana]
MPSIWDSERWFNRRIRAEIGIGVAATALTAANFNNGGGKRDGLIGGSRIRVVGLRDGNSVLKYYRIELWVLAFTRTIFPVQHNSQWFVPEEIMKLLAYPRDFEVKQRRKQEKSIHPLENMEKEVRRGRRGQVVWASDLLMMVKMR